MSERGGARQGAGRKPKAQEIQVIETMDAIAAPKEAWEALWNKCLEGDTAALKLWLAYRFGAPKQKVELDSDSKGIIVNINRVE
jgi:hypothetical protein